MLSYTYTHPAVATPGSARDSNSTLWSLMVGPRWGARLKENQSALSHLNRLEGLDTFAGVPKGSYRNRTGPTSGEHQAILDC